MRQSVLCPRYQSHGTSRARYWRTSWAISGPARHCATMPWIARDLPSPDVITSLALSPISRSAAMARSVDSISTS